MMLAKHGEPRLRRLLSPGKQETVGPARGFFPFRFRREPLLSCLAEILCFMPCHIECWPAGLGLVGDGMHRDDVRDEFMGLVKLVLVLMFQVFMEITDCRFVACGR